MDVVIVNQQEVGSLLPMRECIGVMERVFRSLADGDCSLPLRQIMWLPGKIGDSLVMSLEQIASAIRLLVDRHRVIAEGAGACSVAAALSGKASKGKIACIISGGNIDTSKLIGILEGGQSQGGRQSQD